MRKRWWKRCDPDISAARGGGVATALYERFFQAARRDGRTLVKAVTAPVNEGSIAFHRRLGFSVRGPVEDYDRPGVAHVLFERRL